LSKEPNEKTSTFKTTLKEVRMSEKTGSVSVTLSWLLAIILIGVVALYSWYNEHQKRVLSDREAEIGAAAQQLADTEARLASSKETESRLEAEIADLTAKHQTETSELNNRIADIEAEKKVLIADMEALKTTDAQILAAEKQKAKKAYAELNVKHSAANEEIAGLKAEIDQLGKAMSEATAAHEKQMEEASAAHAQELTSTNEAHEARIAEAEAAHQADRQQIEQQLNERIDFFRTALEGTEPERAAQLGALEQRLDADRVALVDAQQRIDALTQSEADLNQRLGQANQDIQNRQQALDEATRKIEAVQGELSQTGAALDSLRQEYDAAMAQSQDQIAAIEQQLEAARNEHAMAQEAAAAAMEQARSEHAAAMADAEAKIGKLTTSLQAETAALAALQQKHDSMVSGLQEELATTRQSLAGVQDQLDATRDEASRAEAEHAKAIEAANARISGLEETVTIERSQAAQDLAATKQESATALAYVRDLYQDYSALGGRATDQGMLLSLANDELKFGVNQADLPEEIPSLDRIAELLVAHPELAVRIEGHTDDAGRDESNLELSQRRADSVRQALIDRGVDAGLITSQGIGEARPIADNKTAAGRRQNRRVEIYVIENQ
jgi:outer membrane protein OmpA-like peptidoglycan-associated protein